MMFSPEDFELPLEKQLRLRVIDKEIDDCSDIGELKEQLKRCSDSLMRYQHLLAKAVACNIQNSLTEWISTIEEEFSTKTDA